jgi:acetyl-CoA acyltransferase 1
MNNLDRDDDIVICSAVRTPLCRSRKGGLVGIPPATLLQTVLEATLQRNPNLSPTDIQDICVGNVLMPPSGFAACRMAQIAAGIPAESCSLQTVNRQCASSLQSCHIIASSCAVDAIRVGIAAGVESMSSQPMSGMTPPDVNYEQYQNVPTAMDCLLPMGLTSEAIVKDYGLQRHVLDEFAAQSHRKAYAGQAAGKFESEIVPVGNIAADDGIRPTTTATLLSKLKPAFIKGGVTTAGNSSQTTDGAAAVLLMKRREAVRRGLTVQGIWRGYATAGVPPRIMGIGPAVAIPAVLKQCHLTVDDIDVFEINEAFASQAVWCVSELGLDAAKVNPNGGAIALGHPLGCTGARLIATILPELKRRKARYGVVSMCIGTGMGAAAVIEVEPGSSSRMSAL